ncbi:MAG: hypothetical protein KIS87_10465 [Phycisphaeraceae bacterium]|nr:hypothetical protein [Phycisphaeraceae bacterium]
MLTLAFTDPEGDLIRDLYRAAPAIAWTIAAVLLLSCILIRRYSQEEIDAAANSPRLGVIWALISLVIATIGGLWWLTRTDLYDRLIERRQEVISEAAGIGAE